MVTYICCVAPLEGLCLYGRPTYVILPVAEGLGH